MKKLKIIALNQIWQGEICFAEQDEKLEVIKATKENTTVVDKEGMTRTIKGGLNDLVEKKFFYIESFK